MKTSQSWRRVTDKGIVENVWKVPSKSEWGKKYRVIEYEGGKLECECPAVTKNCSHVKMVTYGKEN